MIARGVAFDDNGKAIVAGNPTCFYKNMKVMWLPTDHYDFNGPLNVKGKTEQEIIAEAAKIMKMHGNVH